MGQLIDLAQARADRSRPSRGLTAFFFALDCPISYIAAEHVERVFGEIDWVPVDGPARSLRHPCTGSESNLRSGEFLEIAAHLASRLRLPLVEPDGYPLTDARPISRAALHAVEHGAGRQFALAASRLAFCGGYDLSDPAVIADAASAVDLPVDDVQAAAADTSYDLVLEATARGMRARGVAGAPAIRIGPRWFEGLDAVPRTGTLGADVRALPRTPSGPTA